MKFTVCAALAWLLYSGPLHAQDTPGLSAYIGSMHLNAWAGTDRGTGNGPLAGLVWTLPLGRRQSVRAWGDFSEVRTQHSFTAQMPPAGDGGSGFSMVDERTTSQQVSLGFDYKIKFLDRIRTPYFFVGATATHQHYRSRISSGATHLESSDTTLHSGRSLGFGIQIGDLWDLEIRHRWMERSWTPFPDSYYSLTLGYKFPSR
ncbi:MAG: hypothetical protein HY823_01625 [Acidobacteria bacterium]|nr:hypothetical protein [Acidobacteriota bacterium]